MISIGLREARFFSFHILFDLNILIIFLQEDPTSAEMLFRCLGKSPNISIL